MYKLIVAILGLIMLTACQQDDPLALICLEQEVGVACIINENSEVEFFDANKHKNNYVQQSQCKLGITECTEDKIIICVDYVGPSDIETCDGFDNNCNWEVDEGFDNDEDGVTSCGGDCNDENPLISPNQDELCDLVDNDCSGVVDDIEPIECWEGRPNAEFHFLSQCVRGNNYCRDGEWTGCVDQILHDDFEVCDGIDNDCDGHVDENVVTDGLRCGPISDEGECRYGGEICVNAESVCADPFPVFEQNELCDGLDNDCDGSTDEDLERPCENICGTGFEICVEGDWVECTAPIPMEEICDGVDNDCDGVIDEDCSCDIGAITFCRENVVDADGILLDCGVGTTTCLPGNIWGPCVFLATESEMCDGIDNDCDGIVDGLVASCGETDVGECEFGTAICDEGEWGPCEGLVVPEEERCDGLDNDCDNEVDEGLNPNDKVDMLFIIDISISMLEEIDYIFNAVSIFISDFVDTEHSFGIIILPSDEEFSAVSLNFEVATSPPLTDINSFASVLNSLTLSNGASEYTYDAMLWATAPTNPLDINWRDDAMPYIVVITDEDLQENQGSTEQHIAYNVTNCGIGECASTGDNIETFAIMPDNFFYQFDEIAQYDISRMFDIYPPSTNRYVDIFSQILQNVCVDGTIVSEPTTDGGT